MIPLGILASSTRVPLTDVLLAPTNLASSLVEGLVQLTWTDNNTNETGHRIYRSSSPMDTQALPPPVAELGPDVTEWEDTGTPVDQEVYYIVSAVRGAEEAFSDEVMIDTTTTEFSPEDITTELWLDAADASTVTLTSGRVSTWSDKSGKNRHATQGTAGLRPTWDGADLALVFDGSRGLTAPGFNMAEGTFFFVSESYGDNGNRQAVSRRGGSNWTNLWRYHPPTLGSGSPYTFMSASNSQVSVMPAGTDLPRELSVVAGVYDLSEGEAYVRFNGEEAGRAATAGNLRSSSALWGIGCATGDTGSANPYDFLYGSIREVIFVPNPVGVEVLEKIEGYLAWKWGLVDELPGDHPYKHQKPMKSQA